MASYLRPRRGKKSTANSKNIVLKKGEVFFEAPDTGVGTGVGRIKVGDGSTAYSSLPAFMDLSAITYDVANSTIAFTATSETNNTTLLNKIVTGAKLNVIIAAVKNLLSNLSSSVTTLNNDLEDKTAISDLYTEAKKGASAKRIVFCNSNTKNTPYTEGLTGGITAGYAYINMSSTSYGQVIYFCSGSHEIYVNNYNTDGNGFGSWRRLDTINSSIDLPEKVKFKLISVSNTPTYMTSTISSIAASSTYKGVLAKNIQNIYPGWKPVYAICMGTGHNAVTCYYSGIQSESNLYAEFRNFSASALTSVSPTFLAIYIQDLEDD
jgi:hypothetical protein